MEKIETALRYRAVFAKKQSVIYEKKSRKFKIINACINLVQLLCTVYITSSYYASQYITDANWYNTITADAVIVVLSMILSAVIMFGNFGQIANENLTASKIYHNIYLNLQNEIVKYLPDSSEFDKAQRLSSCAILSNNELQWVEFICPSVMILGKEPTEEELKMEVQNMEIIRELEDIRNRSFRSQIVPIQSVLPPAPQTPLPSILLHGTSLNPVEPIPKKASHHVSFFTHTLSGDSNVSGNSTTTNPVIENMIELNSTSRNIPISPTEEKSSSISSSSTSSVI